jgi:hypothetical protein
MISMTKLSDAALNPDLLIFIFFFCAGKSVEREGPIPVLRALLSSGLPVPVEA